MGKELTKEKAAERLKVSVRSLQRAAQAGKVQPIYHRGKSGKMETFFDTDDLDRYKAELSQVVTPERKPSVTTPDTQALSRIDAPQGNASTRVLFDLLARLVAMQERAALPSAPTHDELRLSQIDVPVSEKFILSLKEASALAGISRDRLLEAIEAGKLKASKDKVRRGWAVKRSDLEVYINKL
jgi:excisionase family DNA binding protein